MTRIHINEVKNISEYNLLHEIINPPKRAKHLNSHYSPILHGSMHIRKGKSKFIFFRILLESGFSSTIVMGMPVEKLPLKKDDPMQWHTQAGNITTNLKVKVYFTLPTLIATHFLTWRYHVSSVC